MKTVNQITDAEEELRDRFINAIEEGNQKKILSTLSKIGNFDSVNEDGSNFIHVICYNLKEIIAVDQNFPELQLWKRLKEKIDACPSAIDWLNNDKESPLIMAQENHGSYDPKTKPYFDYLWGLTKDIDTPNGEDEVTLLYEAFNDRKIPMAFALLKRGANPFRKIAEFKEFACTAFLSNYSNDTSSYTSLRTLLSDSRRSVDFLDHLLQKADGNASLRKAINRLAVENPEIFIVPIKQADRSDKATRKHLASMLSTSVELSLPALVDLLIEQNIRPSKTLVTDLSTNRQRGFDSDQAEYYEKIMPLAARTGALTPTLAINLGNYGFFDLTPRNLGPDKPCQINEKQTTPLHVMFTDLRKVRDADKPMLKQSILNVIRTIPDINWLEKDYQGHRIADLVLASEDPDIIKASGVFNLVFTAGENEQQFRYHTKEEVAIFNFEHENNKKLVAKLQNQHPNSEDLSTMRGYIRIASQCGNIDFLKSVEKNKMFTTLLREQPKAMRVLISGIESIIMTNAASMSHELGRYPEQGIPLDPGEMRMTLAAWKSKKDLTDCYYIGDVAKFTEYLTSQKFHPSNTTHILSIEDRGHAITLVFYPNKEAPDQPTLFFIDSFGSGGKFGYPYYSKELIEKAAEMYPHATFKEAYDSRQTRDRTCRIRTLSDMRIIAKQFGPEQLREHIDNPQHSRTSRDTNNGVKVTSIALPPALLKDSYNLYIRKGDSPGLAHRLEEFDTVTINKKRRETMTTFLPRVLARDTARNHYLDVKLEHMQRDVVDFMLDVADQVQATIEKEKIGKSKDQQEALQAEKEMRVEEALKQHCDAVALPGVPSFAERVSKGNTPSATHKL